MKKIWANKNPKFDQNLSGVIYVMNYKRNTYMKLLKIFYRHIINNC